MKVAGAITLTLGENDGERRKTSLLRVAHEGGAYGRNGVPSISELLCIIADYADLSPQHMFDVSEKIQDWKYARDSERIAKSP